MLGNGLVPFLGGWRAVMPVRLPGVCENGGLSRSRKLNSAEETRKEKDGSKAFPEASPYKGLHQMSLQRFSRLLQHRNGQLMIGGQTQRVAVVTEVPMRPPSPFGDAPFLMSG